MSEDKYSGELHAWIEPELEARFVAMVLGEASDFERDELERLMKERPELAIFKRRLESVDGLVRESVKPVDDEKWKLSPAAREKILAVIGGPSSESVTVAKGEPAKKRELRRSLLSLAACLVLMVGLFSLLTPAVFRPLGLSEEAVAISERENQDKFIELPKSRGLIEEDREYEAKLDRNEGLLAQLDESALIQELDEVGLQVDSFSSMRRKVEPGAPSSTLSAYAKLKKNVQAGNQDVGGVVELGSQLGALNAPVDYDYKAGRASSQFAESDYFGWDDGAVAAGGGGAKDDSWANYQKPRGVWLNKSKADSLAPTNERKMLEGSREEEKLGFDGVVDSSKTGLASVDDGFQDAYRGAITDRVPKIERMVGRTSEGLVRSKKVNEMPGLAGEDDLVRAWGSKEVADVAALTEEEPARGLRSAGFPVTPASPEFEAIVEIGKSVTPSAKPMPSSGSVRFSIDNEAAPLYVAGTEVAAAKVQASSSSVSEPVPVPSFKSTAKFGEHLDVASLSEGKVVDESIVREREVVKRMSLVKEANKSLAEVEQVQGEALLADFEHQKSMAELDDLSDSILMRASQLTESLASIEAVKGNKGRHENKEFSNLAASAESLEKSAEANLAGPSQAREGRSLERMRMAHLSDNQPSIESASSVDFYIRSKPSAIVIPSVNFEDVSVEEALEFLRSRSRELDVTTINPSEKGVDFVLQRGEMRESDRKINLKLENVTLDEAIRAIADQSGLESKVDEYAVKLMAPEIAVNEEIEEALGDPFSEAEGDLDGENAIALEKLNSIIIPSVDFEGITAEEAVDFLRQRSRELDASSLDPEDKGISFMVRKPRIDAGLGGLDADLDAAAGLSPSDPGEAVIDKLQLENVPLSTVLTYIADQAKLRYKVSNGVVTLLPIGGGEGEDLTARSFELTPGLVDELRNGRDDDSPIRELLEDQGITFPGDSAVLYRADENKVLIRNTGPNIDLVDALFEKLGNDIAVKKRSEKERELSAKDEPFSTFSLHVSDVSFKLAQAALAKGEWPEKEKIRSEEFLNAFDYGDPTPRLQEKVACEVEQAVHPFAQQRNLVRVSMRTAATGRGAETPLRLTILLDNSGSMDRADREESVARAFDLLAGQLNPQDEVTLISFARTPRLVRDRMNGEQAQELSNLLKQIPSEGGTNLEAALQLGSEKAKESYLEGAQNRIILMTDGAANLGNAKPDDLRGMIENLRDEGIAFDACGVGADGLNDEILESLTRKGDGRYYFLDRPEDADGGFAKQIAGALRPAAKNVKVQVEFNPERVGRYKLYGFEKHELKKEDFRNDSVDAAELAAEEAGVAMYQVETLPEGDGPVGTVSVRFQDVSTGEMVERTWDIPYEAQPDRLENANPKIRLAASASLLGEHLKGSAVGEAVDLAELAQLTHSLPTLYPNQERVRHLVEMVSQARALAGE